MYLYLSILLQIIMFFLVRDCQHCKLEVNGSESSARLARQWKPKAVHKHQQSKKFRWCTSFWFGMGMYSRIKIRKKSSSVRYKQKQKCNVLYFSLLYFVIKSIINDKSQIHQDLQTIRRRMSLPVGFVHGRLNNHCGQVTYTKLLY